MNNRSIFFLVIFIATCIKINSQTKHRVDSLSGFDSIALKQYIVQNNLNSFEQSLYISKKKRDYKNIKFNILPQQTPQSNKTINSSNTIMSGNLDFEAGNLSGWTMSTMTNINSTLQTTCCAVTYSNAALAINSSSTDPNFSFSLNSPLGGNWVARVGDLNPGYQVRRIENTVNVTSANNYLKIAAKYVLEQANHSCADQPYVHIKVSDVSGNLVVFDKFVQANELPNYGQCAGSNFGNQVYGSTMYGNHYYSNSWDVFCIDMSLLIGNTAKIELTASQCTQGGHGGYAYFDVANISVNNTINFNGNLYPSSSNLGICNSSTATVIAPAGALSYYWQGTGINGATTQSVQVNQPGVYSLVYALPAFSLCTNTSSATVNFTVGTIAPINVAISPTTICNGSSVTFSLSGANTYSIGSTYGYNSYSTATVATIFPPPVTNTFYVTGFTSSGCSSTQSINVTVNPTPTINISGNNFCSGNSGTLVATGANTYTWVEALTNNTVSITNSLVLTPTATTQYNIYGSNSSTGCQSFMNFTTQVATSSLNVSSSLNICLGSNITVGAVGTALSSYTWSSGGNSQNVLLSPGATTSYTLSATNACGILSVPFTVTVNPLPTITVTGLGTVCPNTTHTWTVGGGTTYVVAGFNATLSGTNIIFTPDANNYTVGITGVDANGCQNTTTLNVFVLSGPPLTINGYTASTPFSICNGNSFTLTAGGANSYTWNTGSNTTSFVVTPTVTTCFSFMATDGNGCTDTRSTCLYVNNSSPTITPFPTSYTVCNGFGINLAQQPNQCCMVTYSIDNQYTPYNPNYFVPAFSGTHTLSIENGCAITQATFNVTLLPSPTVTIFAPDSACKNSVVTLTLSGANNYNYNANSGSYTTTNSIVSFSLSNSQTVYVTGSNTNGCYSAVASTTYFIKALDPPSMTITPLSNSVCAGSSIVLTVSASVSSFSWSTGSTANTITLTPTSNTIVSVTSTGTNGCTGSISKTITAVQVPTIIAVATPTAICIGNNGSLNCSGANSYTWSNGFIGGSQLITPTVSTLYSVTGYSTNNPCPATQTVNVIVNPLPQITFLQSQYSVCVGGTVIITATGAASYYYPYPGAGNGSLTIVNAANTNTYIVYGTDANGCSNSAITTVNVLPNPTISVTNNAITCAGAYTMLTASGANSYTWSTGAFTNTVNVNPMVPTQYTVTGADLNGCKDTQFSYVNINPTPNLTIITNTNTICLGNSVNLNVYGAPTYTWNTGSNANNISVTPTSSAVYTVSGSNGICTGTNAIAIMVNTNTSIAVTSTAVCVGNSSATLTASGANWYVWTNGPYSSTIAVTPTVTSTYTVSGDDVNGCTGSVVATVSVNPNPTLSITSSAPILCIGQLAVLTASGASTYTWVNIVTGSSINIIPATNTTYTLIGTDINNCTNTTSFTQSVTICTEIESQGLDQNSLIKIYPNPAKDIFNISCDCLDENSIIEIFNTLGQMILSKKALSKNTEIDLSQYAAGLYYLKVKTENFEETKKIFKE